MLKQKKFIFLLFAINHQKRILSPDLITMINPKTDKKYPVNPKRSWSVTKDPFDEWYTSGGIGFPDDYEFMSGNRPFRKVFKEDDDCNEKPTSVNSDFLIKKDFIRQKFR